MSIAITYTIGVASYGALRHVPPSTHNCLIFLISSETHIGFYMVV